MDSYRDEEMFEGYGPGDGNGGEGGEYDVDGAGDDGNGDVRRVDGGNGPLDGQRVGNNTNVGAD